MTTRARERMDRTLAQLRIDEVSSCLRFVELHERCGRMSTTEATEWRRRLMAWAAFLELELAHHPTTSSSDHRRYPSLETLAASWLRWRRGPARMHRPATPPRFP